MNTRAVSWAFYFSLAVSFVVFWCGFFTLPFWWYGTLTRQQFVEGLGTGVLMSAYTAAYGGVVSFTSCWYSYTYDANVCKWYANSTNADEVRAAANSTKQFVNSTVELARQRNFSGINFTAAKIFEDRLDEFLHDFLVKDPTPNRVGGA